MSVNSAMTAIANAIRNKTGATGTMTLDQMAAAIAGITGGGKTVASARCVTTGANGWLLGDCNGDGVYDFNDLVALRTAPLDIADVNGDGVVDDDDAQYIGDAEYELAGDECLCRVEITYDDGSVEKIVTKAKRTGIIPTGSIEITENGAHDVAAFAAAIVNVAGGGGDYLVERGTISFHTGIGTQAMAIPVSDVSYQNYMLFARAIKSWKKVGGVWTEQASIDFSGTTHNRMIVSQLIAAYPARQTSWVTVQDGETAPIVDTFGIETHLQTSYREQNSAFVNLCPAFVNVANPSIDAANSCVVFHTQRDVCNDTVGVTYQYAIVGWNNG